MSHLPASSPQAAPQSPGTVPQEPWLEVTSDRQFGGWLSDQKISVAFTTYQTGKLFLLGTKQDGQLAVFERTFSRCMGLWSDGQTIWMNSIFQLLRLENLLRPRRLQQGHGSLHLLKE